MSYELYGLARNPFSTERHDYPIVGREGVLNELKYNLNRMVAGGGPHFIVIKGGYGLGKTRILFELITQLREGKFIKGKTLVPVRPIRTLPPRPPATYLSKYLLPEIFRGLGKESLRTLREALEDISRELSEDGAIILEKCGVDRDFRQAFLALNTEMEESAWRWFLGETLSASDRRILGEIRRIATEETAERVLIDFLKTLAVTGYQAVILPLDEFEYLSIQPKTRQFSLIEVFRSIYDRVVNELTVVKKVATLVVTFAVTPEGWDRIEKISEAKPLLERVYYDKVFLELTPLDEDQVGEFISKRLQQDRLPKASIPYPLFPFEEDCLHFLYTTTRGRPRLISSYCCRILDEGIRQRKKVITGTFAEGILRESGLYVEAIPIEKVE